jgi:prefoldin subunit 5
MMTHPRFKEHEETIQSLTRRVSELSAMIEAVLERLEDLDQRSVFMIAVVNGEAFKNSDSERHHLIITNPGQIR